MIHDPSLTIKRVYGLTERCNVRSERADSTLQYHLPEEGGKAM